MKLNRLVRQRRLRFRRWWMKARWGVEIPPGMLPTFGEGKYVSVKKRGPYLDITDHRKNGMVRLIPFQPNHGIMVEFWEDGRMRWRTHLGYDALSNLGFGTSEVRR